MARRVRRGISYSDSFSSLWSWVFGAAVLAGLGYGVFYAIGKVNDQARKDVDTTPALISKKGRSPALSSTSGKGPAPQLSSAALQKDLLDRAAGDLNAAVLAREAARLRNDRGGTERHLADANDARRRLEELGKAGPLPDHLEPGDEVTGFEDVAITGEAGGDHLARAARAIPPGTFYKVRVRRNGGPKEVYLYFPTAAGAETAASERVKISTDFARELQQQVLSLPPEKLFPDERQKIAKILGEGSASREEYAFLVRKLSRDGAGSLFDEKESFATQIGTLEKMLPAAPVPDALLTKDGHRIPGAITGETPSTITIQTVLMPLTIPKEDVQVVYTAKELREEFDRRLKTALGRTEAFPQLLIWCRDWGLPVHKELVAFHMMTVDRNDRQARLAVNYFSAGDGKWSTRGNIAGGGPIPAAVRPESKADIRPLLEGYGFTESGGKWFLRVKWATGVDSLHQPGNFPIKMQGVAIMPWREDDTPLSRDESIRGRKVSNAPPRLRFLAPVAAQGIVTLSVEAPGMFADCQLRAVGAVIERGHGARIEVFLTPEGGKSTTLYNVDDGGNDAWHDIGLQVAGKKSFTVSARITTTKDTYHTYARFLTSLPESKQTFWVRGTLLQPAPEADRVWLGAR